MVVNQEKKYEWDINVVLAVFCDLFMLQKVSKTHLGDLGVVPNNQNFKFCYQYNLEFRIPGYL